MGNTDYQAYLQPTSQLVDEVLTFWQQIVEQVGESEHTSQFEQRLVSLISRSVAVAEIGGQQMQTGGQKSQRQSALTGQR